MLHAFGFTVHLVPVLELTLCSIPWLKVRAAGLPWSSSPPFPSETRPLRAGTSPVNFCVPQWTVDRVTDPESLHVGGLYGLKKTVLDHLQVGSLTGNMTQVNETELPVQ